MACTLSNKCAKNLSKRTVLLQLIIKNVVTCFFGTQCRLVDRSRQPTVALPSILTICCSCNEEELTQSLKSGRPLQRPNLSHFHRADEPVQNIMVFRFPADACMVGYTTQRNACILRSTKTAPKKVGNTRTCSMFLFRKSANVSSVPAELRCGALCCVALWNPLVIVETTPNCGNYRQTDGVSRVMRPPGEGRIIHYPSLFTTQWYSYSVHNKS